MDTDLETMDLDQGGEVFRFIQRWWLGSKGLLEQQQLCRRFCIPGYLLMRKNRALNLLPDKLHEQNACSVFCTVFSLNFGEE